MVVSCGRQLGGSPASAARSLRARSVRGTFNLWSATRDGSRAFPLRVETLSVVKADTELHQISNEFCGEQWRETHQRWFGSCRAAVFSRGERRVRLWPWCDRHWCDRHWDKNFIMFLYHIRFCYNSVLPIVINHQKNRWDTAGTMVTVPCSTACARRSGSGSGSRRPDAAASRAGRRR